MEAPRSKLSVPLLLLTLAGLVLACGSVNLDSGLLRRSDVCEVELFTLNSRDNICLTDTSRIGLQNTSGARDQIPFRVDIEDTEDSSAAPASSFYTVAPIPGKGLGVIATTPISRGTKIIIEEPLITVPMPSLVPGQGFPLASMLASITTSFASLPPSSQATFLSLHDHRFPGDEDAKQSHLLTIFRSNAYNTGTSHVGLFPLIARINHSCRPNSVNYWSEKLGKRVIYAGRDIEIGEEVTVAYIPLLKSTNERQSRLAQYGFVCGCEACRDEGSGKMRGKIADLMDVLEGKVAVGSEKVEVNERLAKRAERLVGMLREEGLVDYLAKAYRFVAVFKKRAGNLEKARMWAEREIEELRMAEDGSEEVEMALEFPNALRP